MSETTSRFKFNQDDYPKGTVLLREYEYKGYFIREFEQEPSEAWKKMMLNDDDSGIEERGEGGYQILNEHGEIIDTDWIGMGDSASSEAEITIDHITKTGWLYE